MQQQLFISMLICCGIMGSIRNATGCEPVVQFVSSTATTVLLAHDAHYSSTLKEFQPNQNKPFARFYVGNWREPDQSFAWMINVSKQGSYEVAIISEGASAVTVDVKESRVQGMITKREWNRTRLGELSLHKGTHTLRLALREKLAQEGKLRAIELTPIAAKADIAKRVSALRADTAWFNKAKYGVMFQWGEWGYPMHGPAKKWPAMIDDFDVDRFAKMVAEETGAGFVIWSITWRGSRISAPLNSVEKIVPGYTTKRDLIGDLANALGKRGIKLMLYYHPGHEDQQWWQANWKSSSDTTRFVDNWVAVISEIGERYGENLAGWFFDDGIIYPAEQFERMASAAKTGYKGRLVSWNSWILPSLTDFQDVQFGEGWRDNVFPPTEERGIWSVGPHQGLQAHSMFMADGPDWGIWKANTQIKQLITPKQAVQRVEHATKHGHVVTINLQMYEDGSVSPQSLQALQAVRDAFRKN